MYAWEPLDETYLHLKGQITQIDQQIKKHLVDVIDGDTDKKHYIASKKPHKRKNKNAIRGLDMWLSYQYFEGVDLMAIEGVNDAPVMAVKSEIGPEGTKKSASAEQFTSWLRLAPTTRYPVERYYDTIFRRAVEG